MLTNKYIYVGGFQTDAQNIVGGIFLLNMLYAVKSQAGKTSQNIYSLQIFFRPGKYEIASCTKNGLTQKEKHGLSLLGLAWE